MRRTNTWQAAVKDGAADVDLGGGLSARIPLGDMARSMVTVDHTVGRRAFAWDAGNNRAQMIHGDTGLRDISALCPTRASGTIHLHRVGNSVTLVLTDFVPNVAGATVDIFAAGALPAGFRPAISYWFMTPATVLSTMATEQRSIAVASNGWVPIYNSPKTTDRYRQVMTFFTSNEWPAELPGTAVGSPA